MSADGSTRPRTRVLELAVCFVLLVTIALVGLHRMDFLNPATAHEVRMTDNSRSALVARNLVEGRGYTTRELPAFLLDTYDHRGKLHADEWPNADRFPFTTYAIAALYLATGSTSWKVGIVAYNAICFVGFFLALYALARAIWGDRWIALATLGIALVHPLAYWYPLYSKDADTLALTTAVMAGLFRYVSRRPDEVSWKLFAGLGTVIAWLFLARPNIGGGFGLCFGVLALRRAWGAYRVEGWRAALRGLASHELIAVAAIILWCLPFSIYSLSEWGVPFYTANATYQQPLGTRFAMDTDTWWKYSEPGHVLTLGTLAAEAPGQLLAKFTTSWLASFRAIVHSFAIELVLTFGLLAWLARRAAREGDAGAPAPPAELAVVVPRGPARAFVTVAKIVGVVFLLNLAVLPLYGYQHYKYHHYLGFCMPLLWLASGAAVGYGIRALRPAGSAVREHLRVHGVKWALAGAVGVVLWNLGRRSQDSNQFFARLSEFFERHWILALTLLAVLAFHRWLLRLPRFAVAAASVTAVVLVWLAPVYQMKRYNVNWFPENTAVWDVLRQRHGLVVSFALQGEVNWVSDRRNIPAPELPMHIYSFLFDHQLEAEDVYIESAAALIGPADGPFYFAAPGFEGYARLERFQGRLPGYELIYHSEGKRAAPKYRLTKPRPKASTVYRLKDREAMRAMGESPAKLELGLVDNVIYTAHGWGDYFVLDGKPAVAATDATRRRFRQYQDDLRPHEASSVTFFLDDRRPSSVELEIYAPHRTTLDFFWNLDLYYYDVPSERPAKRIGTYTVTQPGWQRVKLEVPHALTRRGINKLGFTSSQFRPVSVCPKTMSPAACAMKKESPDDSDVIPLASDGITEAVSFQASVFAGTLELQYPANAQK